MFLLIDKSKNARALPYAQQYMLFEDYESCRAEADQRGFEDSFGMLRGRPPEPGMMQNYACGDVDVSIMSIQRQKCRT
jgi:hypothetical protein